MPYTTGPNPMKFHLETGSKAYRVSCLNASRFNISEQGLTELPPWVALWREKKDGATLVGKPFRRWLVGVYTTVKKPSPRWGAKKNRRVGGKRKSMAEWKTGVKTWRYKNAIAGVCWTLPAKAQYKRSANVPSETRNRLDPTRCYWYIVQKCAQHIVPDDVFECVAFATSVPQFVCPAILSCSKFRGKHTRLNWRLIKSLWERS